MEVSWNGATPKSPIFGDFPWMNHPAIGGTPTGTSLMETSIWGNTFIWEMASQKRPFCATLTYWLLVLLGTMLWMTLGPLGISLSMVFMFFFHWACCMYQITLFASFGGISYVCYSKQHVFCFFLGGYHMLQETMFHSQWGNISINNQ